MPSSRVTATLSLSHLARRTSPLVDLDGFLYAAKAGYGVRGAHLAGTPHLAPVFVEDMMHFWTSVMAPSTS